MRHITDLLDAKMENALLSHLINKLEADILFSTIQAEKSIMKEILKILQNEYDENKGKICEGIHRYSKK